MFAQCFLGKGRAQIETEPARIQAPDRPTKSNLQAVHRHVLLRQIVPQHPIVGSHFPTNRLLDIISSNDRVFHKQSIFRLLHY